MPESDHEDQPQPKPKRAISPARLAANRANSLLSSGPRSPLGKSRSKLNGLDHGLCSKEALLPGEDGDELQRRHHVWIVELGAETEAECRSVANAVDASWRMDRCLRAETAAVTRSMLAVVAR